MPGTGIALRRDCTAGRLAWNPGTQVGKGQLPLKNQGARRKGGQGLCYSRVLGGVESTELEGLNPSTVWMKGRLKCCSRGTLGTRSKRQSLFSEPALLRPGSPLPPAAAQIQEAFRLPGSEHETS